MDTRFRLFMALALLFYACGGGGGSSGGDPAGNPGAGGPQAATYVVLASNDLGMHCMDREFSVFSIMKRVNLIPFSVSQI